MTDQQDFETGDPSGLVQQLDQLAERLTREPPRLDGEPMQLAGLLPAEPVVGPVVVVAWQAAPTGDSDSDVDGGPAPEPGVLHYELVRLDGAAVSDPRALRETLVLIAMTESLEEQLDPLRLREVVDLLLDWQEQLGAADGAALEAARPLERDLRAAAWAAVEQLQAVEQEVASTGRAGVRVAHALRLDQLATMGRQLDERFQQLEVLAERWSEAVHEEQAGLVQQVWSAISHARRGPLSMPVSDVVEQGRAAGAALADEAAARTRRDSSSPDGSGG